MKKIITILLAACLFTLPLMACKKDNDGLTKVRLNEVTHSVFYAPLYLAISLDYFKEEGIKIELTDGKGADKVMTALITGAADIGFCGPEAAIYVYNEGGKNYPKVFAQLTKRDGSFIVSRTDEKDTFEWSKLTNKEILSGRKGGMPYMTLQYVLNQNNLFNGQNITMNSAVEFANMGPAFTGGTGDYTTLFEPAASNVEAEGKGYVVASVGQESGEVPYTAFIAKQSYLTDNADTVKSFIKALYRAIDYMKKNSKSTVAEKLLSQFPGLTQGEMENVVESYLEIDAWMTDGMAMTEDSFNRLQDIMENAGELDKRAVYADLIFNDYANEVYSGMFG